MKRKLRMLSVLSFAIAIVIFIFSYILFHYIAPDGSFTAVYQTAANKPFVTLLFGIWGVMFLFSGVMSFLAACIFCRDTKERKMN